MNMWTFLLFMVGAFIVTVLIGSKDMIKVNLKDFTSNYRSAIEFDDFIKYQEMMLRGVYSIKLPKDYVSKVKEKHRQNKDQEALLFKTAELNNIGMELEKKGQIDDAIDVYEENIKGGYKARHSYDRLMILYRKKKDYDNEIRVINLALDVFAYDQVSVNQYQQRLEKVKKYKNKQ